MPDLSLAALTDLVKSVGVAHEDKMKPFNDAARLDSHIFGRMLGGMAEAQYMGTGIDITSPIQLTDVGVARQIGIAEDESWTRNDNVVDLKFYNRKTETHYVLLKDEMVANGIINPSGGDFNVQRFLDLKKTKEQAAITSALNHINGTGGLAGVPDPVTMEGPITSTAKAVTSIFAIVNEWANGLPTATPSGTAYTTKAGQSPTAAGVSPNFTPVQTTYTTAALTMGNILDALGSATRKTSFPRPTTFSEYFESPEMRRWMILTSDMGCRAFESLQRTGQHQWESFGEGGVKNSTYLSIPVTYWASMDTAAIYTDGSTGLFTEGSSSTTIAGPRFLGIPGDWVHPVINKNMFWEYDEVFRNTPSQPDQYVFRLQLWWNMKYQTLRRTFAVSPAVGSGDPYGTY